MNDILVSICTVTYNHQNYIAQAIEGFLAQKTDFKFEVIIGEDCSTDNTLKIVKDYQERYPEIIKILTSDSNVGYIENYVRTYNAARGKYIAICDGDDCWINDNKLQRQINFLEEHQDYAICFHNSHVIHENDRILDLYCEFKGNQSFTLNDILKNNIMPTSSVVCRNNISEDFFFKLRQVKVDDWILHIYNAERGKIYYIDEVWANYRAHQGGIWAKLSPNQKVRFRIDSILDMNKAFDYKYDKEFRESLFQIYMNKPFGYKDVLRYYKKKIKRILTQKWKDENSLPDPCS